MTENKHEIIHFTDDMPINLFVHKLGFAPRHWHSSMEILFVLSGNVYIEIDNASYNLKSDDLIVINREVFHELRSNDCEMVVIQLKLEKLTFIKHYLGLSFQCCSADGIRGSEVYDYLRYLIARLIKVNVNGCNDLKTMSLVYSLLNELCTSFRTINTLKTNSNKYHDRIEAITHYIKTHFREGITLSQVAANQNLTTPYLSKFFEKSLGVNFFTYYNTIRLEHAVNEMLTSDVSIETIARNNGFPDSRSFVSLFKKQYGMLPSNYRKNNVSSEQLSYSTQASIVNVSYEKISNAQVLSKLAKYLKLFDDDKDYQNNDYKLISIGTIDTNTTIKKLTHNFHTILTIGAANLLMHAKIQKMIIKAQKEIGYKYLSFHGLLSDDMMVYSEDLQGNVLLSFEHINEIFDFILEINMKPFVKLSFMPQALADSTVKIMFEKRLIISKPKSIEKWCYLIRSLTEHLINRYGKEEVETWPFGLWNEPDLSIFSFTSNYDFFHFYCQTYNTVKSIDNKIKFGAPPLFYSLSNGTDWAKLFFAYTKEKNCYPDFIEHHYYDDWVESMQVLSINKDNPEAYKTIYKAGEILNELNPDPDYMEKYLDNFYTSLKEMCNDNLPNYITEWNLTVSHRNLINDTCFKSCYIAKNLLENYDRVDSFGYWSLTDYIEESPLPSELFHGGLGMLTKNGIPKANYNVFKMLGKLCDNLLGQGKGWFATRGNNKIVLMLYNYTHFSKLFASGELFDMTFTDRYTPFTQMQKANVTATLTGLINQRCIIKEFFVNREAGSSFDAWVKMGAMPLILQDDIDLLIAASAPGLQIHAEDIIEGMLNINITLEPLEVKMVEIELI